MITGINVILRIICLSLLATSVRNISRCRHDAGDEEICGFFHKIKDALCIAVSVYGLSQSLRDGKQAAKILALRMLFLDYIKIILEMNKGGNIVGWYMGLFETLGNAAKTSERAVKLTTDAVSALVLIRKTVNIIIPSTYTILFACIYVSYVYSQKEWRRINSKNENMKSRNDCENKATNIDEKHKDIETGIKGLNGTLFEITGQLLKGVHDDGRTASLIVNDAKICDKEENSHNECVNCGLLTPQNLTDLKAHRYSQPKGDACLRYASEIIRNLEIIRNIIHLPYQVPSYLSNFVTTNAFQGCDFYIKHAIHTLNIMSFANLNSVPTDILNFEFYNIGKQYERIMSAMHYVLSNIGINLIGICTPPRSDMGIFIYSDKNFVNRLLFEVFDYVVNQTLNDPKICFDFFLLSADLELDFLKPSNYTNLFKNIKLNTSSTAMATWTFTFKCADPTQITPNDIYNYLTAYVKNFIKVSNILINVDTCVSSAKNIIIIQEMVEVINCMDSNTYLSTKIDNITYEKLCYYKEMCNSLKMLINVCFLHITTEGMAECFMGIKLYYDALGVDYNHLNIEKKDVTPAVLVPLINNTVNKLKELSNKIYLIVTVEDDVPLFNFLINNIDKLPQSTAIICVTSIHIDPIASLNSDNSFLEKSESVFIGTFFKPLTPIKFYMNIIEAYCVISKGMNFRKNCNASPIPFHIDPRIMSRFRNDATIDSTSKQKDRITLLSRVNYNNIIPSDKDADTDFCLDQVNFRQEASRPSSINFFDYNKHGDALNIITGINVIITEGDEFNRKVIIKLLSKMGLSISVANTGQEVIDMYKAKRYHLVIISLFSQDISGPEIVKKIRQFEASKKQNDSISEYSDAESKEDERNADMNFDAIIIAVISPNDSLSDTSFSNDVKFNDYVVKPINLVQFERKIIEWSMLQAVIDYTNVFKQAVKKREVLYNKFSPTNYFTFSYGEPKIVHTSENEDPS